MRIKQFTLALLLFLCYQGFSFGQQLLDLNGQLIMKLKPNGDVVDGPQEYKSLFVQSDGRIRRDPNDPSSCISFHGDTLYDENNDLLGWVEGNGVVKTLNGQPVGSIKREGSETNIYDTSMDRIGYVKSNSISHKFLAFFYFFHIQGL